MDQDKKIEDLSEDGEIRRLMDDHGIDEDTAEKAQQLIEEEGLDEDEAVELAEEI